MSRENDGFVFHRDLLQWVPDVIYRAVNFFVTWDKLPTLLGAVNLSAFRDRLRERNLHHTGSGAASPRWNTGNIRWRAADGSFNSLDHPRMGMAGARFGRNFALSECVPDSVDDLLEPSPRVFSEELLARHEFIPATSL